MPQLFFDTEKGQAVLTTLRQSIKVIRAEQERIKSAADGLVPAHWQAEGVNQFLEMSEAAQGAMNHVLEQFDALAIKLDFELGPLFLQGDLD